MKHTLYGFIAAAGLAALTTACGGQESQVIDSYFRAVQAKDTGTVSAFSLASFEQDVKSWKIKSVGEEQRTKATISALAKAMKDADEAAAQNKKDAGAYFNAHPLEVDKVKPLVENDKPVPANLQKTAADWKKFTDIDKDLKSKAASAKTAYEKEKRAMIMSVGQSSFSDNLEGDAITKTANVEVETGGDVKNFVITLRKYEVASNGQAQKISSRWLIQSITPQ